LIQLCKNGTLHDFYREVENALTQFLNLRGVDFDRELLHQSIWFNFHLLKVPFQNQDLKLDFGYNIWEFYRSVILRQNVKLEKIPMSYVIERSKEQWSSWDEWCEKMVWFANRRGAYFYGATPAIPTPAGHY